MLLQHRYRSINREVILDKRLWVFCAVALFLSGCISGGGSTTRRSASIQAAKKVKASPAELSVRNQSLLALYCAEIEAGANKVMFEAKSPIARRQALVWKAETIPLLQNAMLKTDPLAAALDTWVFIFQLKDYLGQPAVQQLVGELHPVVDNTIKTMDAQMEELIRTVAPSVNIANLRQRLTSWAEAHPIQAGLLGRQSLDIELIQRVEQEDLGAVASIRALEEGLGDLTARLDAYNLYAPKQARWQAELLITDLMRAPQLGTAMSNLAEVSSAAAKASNSIDHMPEYLSQTRTALVSDLQGQRLATQAFVDQQRVATLDALRLERIAALASLHNERLAATADLRGERQIVLDAVHSEQQAAVAGVQKISNDSLQAFDARARGLIDHFFWRALELVLFTLVLCSLASWILLRRFAARRPVRDETRYDRAA